MRPIVVGYTSNTKKQKEFFDRLIQNTDKGTLTWVSLPLGDSHCLSDSIDVILHKRTDDMVAAIRGDLEAWARVQALEKWVAQCPSLDPMSGVWQVIDRVKLYGAIDGLCPSFFAFSVQPNSRSDTIARDVQRTTGFPFILKRRVACGTSESHSMALIRSPTALSDAVRSIQDQPYSAASIDRDWVAQKFIPHTNTILKAYMLGSDNIHVVSKPTSVPLDVPPSAVRWFDSQAKASDLMNLPARPSEAVRALVRTLCLHIASRLNISLLGVDVVIDKSSGECTVVDVNYFPSYKGVPDVPRILSEILLAKAARPA